MCGELVWAIPALVALWLIGKDIDEIIKQNNNETNL